MVFRTGVDGGDAPAALKWICADDEGSSFRKRWSFSGVKKEAARARRRVFIKLFFSR